LKKFRYLAAAVEFEEGTDIDLSMDVLGSKYDLIGSVFVIIGQYRQYHAVNDFVTHIHLQKILQQKIMLSLTPGASRICI